MNTHASAIYIFLRHSDKIAWDENVGGRKCRGTQNSGRKCRWTQLSSYAQSVASSFLNRCRESVRCEKV